MNEPKGANVIKSITLHVQPSLLPQSQCHRQRNVARALRLFTQTQPHSTKRVATWFGDYHGQII
jgi:hypothetical protein